MTEGTPNIDSSGLLPFATQAITLTTASYVDDYDQWLAQLANKFVPSAEYIDHYFNEPTDHSSIISINNYESFGYESLSNEVPTLSLLNIHDQEDFPVDTAGPNGLQMQQFLDQFSINREEAIKRQHIFFGKEKIQARSRK